MFGSLWQVLPHDESGSGPAVVMLHAGIADRTMWSEYLGPLAEAGYRAVALDLAGFGEAPIAAGEQAPWIDVLATMDALEIHDATLVGNSFGGAVALRAAVVAPERVAALVLISASAPDVEPTPELEEAWAEEERALERGDVEAAVSSVLDTWTLPNAPAELRERIATMQRRSFEQRADAEDVEDAVDPVGDDPELIRGLSMPTLIAVGEKDKPDFQQAAGHLAELLPNAHLEVIQGAGHLAPLETPEEFKRLLLGFLRERAT